MQVPVGTPVQIKVEAARPPDMATPEEIKATTNQLSAVLGSPTVLRLVEGLIEVIGAKAGAELEKAKAQALAQAEVEKARAVSADQTQKLYGEIANKFLRNLLVLGLAALGLLGWMAWTKVVDGQVFSVLATVVITSVFGGTIYGTTLRPKDKS
ncbi:MAG: hypothetical protein ACOZIN_01165 [Myxococcota bacterium]